VIPFRRFVITKYYLSSLELSIGILKNNREKDKDLVATGILGGTGILPAILGRLASRPYSLSHHFASAPIRIGHGRKTFENRYSARLNRLESELLLIRVACPEGLVEHQKLVVPNLFNFAHGGFAAGGSTAEVCRQPGQMRSDSIAGLMRSLSAILFLEKNLPL
jgi:hypothetical protein